MKLTKRLIAIASLVDRGVNVIDIGCDHALIDIYLTLYNKNTCIASDINKNALSIAQNNIKKYNLDIKTVLSNGFKNIDISKNTTAIIAGMGTVNIIEILSGSDLTNLDNIIIQSNTNLYELRKHLYELGYYIENEKIVFERNIYYIIIKFKKGIKIILENELKFGPLIIKSKDNIKKNYFEYLIRINNNIIENSNDIESIKNLKEDNLFLEENK